MSDQVTQKKSFLFRKKIKESVVLWAKREVPSPHAEVPVSPNLDSGQMKLASVTSGPTGRPREVRVLSLSPDLAPKRMKPNPVRLARVGSP